MYCGNTDNIAVSYAPEPGQCRRQPQNRCSYQEAADECDSFGYAVARVPRSDARMKSGWCEVQASIGKVRFLMKAFRMVWGRVGCKGFGIGGFASQGSGAPASQAFSSLNPGIWYLGLRASQIKAHASTGKAKLLMEAFRVLWGKLIVKALGLVALRFKDPVPLQVRRLQPEPRDLVLGTAGLPDPAGTD
eukprot:s2994_g6.t1